MFVISKVQEVSRRIGCARDLNTHIHIPRVKSYWLRGSYCVDSFASKHNTRPAPPTIWANSITHERARTHPIKPPTRAETREHSPIHHIPPHASPHSSLLTPHLLTSSFIPLHLPPLTCPSPLTPPRTPSKNSALYSHSHTIDTPKSTQRRPRSS